MNLKQKVKTYSFWISLISAVLIVVRIIGEHFGWFINESFIMDIVTGICGILVLLGILSSPTNKEESMEETINTLQKQSEQIQTEQKQLAETIKEDVIQKQLSIEEQIAKLKGVSANSNKVVTEEQSAEQLEGIVYVEAQEIISPLVTEQQQTTLLSQEVEEILLGEELSQQLQESDHQEIVEPICQENIAIEQTEIYNEEATNISFPNLEEIDAYTKEEIDTLTVDDNLENLAKENLSTESVTEQVSAIDFSKMTNEELKNILFEILQRL